MALMEVNFFSKALMRPMGRGKESGSSYAIWSKYVLYGSSECK